MSFTYFVRGGGASWAVIKLYLDNHEKIVADGLSLIEAEILCSMRLEDIPSPAPPAGLPKVDEKREQKRAPVWQLAFKF